MEQSIQVAMQTYTTPHKARSQNKRMEEEFTPKPVVDTRKQV